MTVETVDAVVIGAGPNGLVAANALADFGWDVLLLEANDTVGGAVRSAEITAPGFRSDLFSAFYPLAAASPVIRNLDLGNHGLTWVQAEKVLAHALPDGRAVRWWGRPGLVGHVRRLAKDSRSAAGCHVHAFPAGEVATGTASPDQVERGP